MPLGFAFILYRFLNAALLQLFMPLLTAFMSIVGKEKVVMSIANKISAIPPKQ